MISAFNTGDLKGLSEESAIKTIQSNDLDAEVYIRDGKHVGRATAEYRTDRIRLEVSAGLVVRAWVG